MSRKREQWSRERDQWARAMQQVAKECGEEHRKAFGSVAWGRYQGEPSGADTKDKTVFGAAFLQGMRYALLQVARLQGWPEEGLLERIHDRIKS